MSFEAVERVADAVLYEGYLLYPYRPSAPKNQVRWQFGVVAPRAPRNTEGEPWFSHTECLAERSAATLSIRLRGLRPVALTADPDAAHSPAMRLQGVPHAVDLDPLPLSACPVSRTVTVCAEGVAVKVRVDLRPAGAYIRLRIRIANREPWQPAFAADRDAMLQHSLVATHVLLALDGGAFVSLLEPPEAAAALAARCSNRHTWPVLAGDRARRNLMLSSPIVLYDFPSVAAESPGDLFDAAEIDEILSLRILTLTDEEKREARAADPRARGIIDRVDNMTPETLARLHGTLRSADFFNPEGTPSPDEARVLVQGVPIGRGARVRLRPSRRSDSMDIFLRGQAATVAGVHHDVDDRAYVAVTVDADPAADLHDSFGRYFYFDPSELELIPHTRESP